MPRRASPGDREALEAALTPTLRAAVEELHSREVIGRLLTASVVLQSRVSLH